MKSLTSQFLKKLSFGLLVGLALLQVTAAEAEWTTDLPKALAKAKAENKLVLIEFTGSDYCPPCKALHKTVMTSPEFVSYAKTNLVLVEADCPRSKEQSKELKTSNAALSRRFKIEGYPTVIVLNGEGRQLKKDVGYDGQSANDFVAALKKLK